MEIGAIKSPFVGRKASCAFVWHQTSLLYINSSWRQLQLGTILEARLTFQCNILQHCRAQRVTHVWPPCSDMLKDVGRCWIKFKNSQILVAILFGVAICCARSTSSLTTSHDTFQHCCRMFRWNVARLAGSYCVQRRVANARTCLITININVDLTWCEFK